jgi:hypothetical protein
MTNVIDSIYGCFQIRVGESSARTKKIKNTLNPEWNTVLTLRSLNAQVCETGELLVKAFDWNAMTNHGLLGELKLKLSGMKHFFFEAILENKTSAFFKQKDFLIGQQSEIKEMLLHEGQGFSVVGLFLFYFFCFLETLHYYHFLFRRIDQIFYS